LTEPTVLRPGAIVLARHGEPAISRKVKLTAEGYGRFWAEYETRGILPGQAPPQSLVASATHAGVLLSSIRPRAIESAKALNTTEAFTQEAILVEAPLPPPPFPGWVRFSPKIWGFLSRFWWWYFNFHHAGQESRAEAEARADVAAAMLIAHAETGRDVVILAHGFFNFMIGRALKARGWRMTFSEGFRYWSTRKFERA
jgi:broad specificity phosphatase PhoE